MTAGFSSRNMARTKVSIAPIALAGLVGAALLIGGMLGAVATSALDPASTNGRSAQVNATSAGLEAQALIQFRAGERESAAQAVAPHAQDHIGISERLFPAAAQAVAPHAQDHIGISERLFPIVVRHAVKHGPLAD